MKGFWGEARPRAPPCISSAPGGSQQGQGWCRPFSTRPSGGFGVGAQRGAPGGALFPHLTAPSPSPPHRLTSTASATSTTSAPPNLGTNDPPTPYPSATRELEAPPDVPSPPVTSGSPPVGTPPGAGGSRELALGARGPGAAAGASSGAISRFLAGPGAEQMEALPRSLQARLRATAGSPACCSHPKIPPPPGAPRGKPSPPSRCLVLGFWAFPRAPTLPTQPLPLLGTSLGAGCSS